MKKVFALLLVFVMLLSAAPVLAEETPQIESVVLPNDPSYPRVSINLQNLPPINDTSKIEVELYSREKLLTKVWLNPDKLSELDGRTYLTCCIPFTGADEYWPQDPEFKPQRDVVADKAVLYVGGQQPVEKTFELDGPTWNAMVPETPQIESVLLSNDDFGRRVSINLQNLPPINDTSKIEVELYSREKLLTKVWLNPDKLSELDGSTYLTCCIPFTGADEYWPQKPEFKPQRDVVADKAVLYVGGKEADVETFDLDPTAWNAMVPETPQIESVLLSNDDFGRRVSINLQNLPPINDTSKIEVELYSREKLLTKVWLNPDKLSELDGSTYLTCCIPFTGADEYWPQDPEFKPQINVVADRAVLYVEGKEADVETFDLDPTAWNAMVPITPDDPYYPPYNPTPVQPTQPGMLPPQTGDMPLWYAIVHFLGLA